LKSKKYDWIVVGGGAAGIAIAEILARMGLEILIIEKNKKLADETSGIFHEWLHTGSLYTLTPDKLETTRYLLGALDDLLMYYSIFKNMNLIPSRSGLKVQGLGWFNNDNIEYRFKVRPFNPIWSIIVARSLSLIDEIKKHDWLRQRAGSKFDRLNLNITRILKFYPSLKEEFTCLPSPDITINSKNLLSDLLNSYKHNNGNVITDVEVTKINDKGHEVILETSKGEFFSKKSVLCCADGITKFTKFDLKISYAPMFVVESRENKINSFVELDIIIKNCINMIKKSHNYGLAGGISLKSKDQVRDYIEFCIKSHLKIDPSLVVLDQYIGLKKELVKPGLNRNYLFHINSLSENVWSIILGKFTLMFSLGPEFIRRVYNRNIDVNKTLNNNIRFSKINNLISDRQWEKIVKSKEI